MARRVNIYDRMLGDLIWFIFRNVVVTIVVGMSLVFYYRVQDGNISPERPLRPWMVVEKTHPNLPTIPICDDIWYSGTAKCRYRDDDGNFDTFMVNEPQKTSVTL